MCVCVFVPLLGVDTKSEACQRFFREGLTISFTKILTDDAVSSWKPEIHKCILSNSQKLVDLIGKEIRVQTLFFIH